MRLATLALFALVLVPAAPVAAAQRPLAECIAQRGGPAAQADLTRLPTLRSICFQIASDEERVRRLNATARIYEDQIFQSRVLLFMVVLLTIAGILLSALQLGASYKLALAGRGTLAEGGDVSLGAGSAAVKSSVVGVVILALSLGFFGIFVSQVYKITPAAATVPGGVGEALTVPEAGPGSGNALVAGAANGATNGPAGMTEVSR